MSVPGSAPDNAHTAASQSTPFPVAVKNLGKDGTTPALPPQMASVRSHTADEVVQMMNRTPLFMTSLDEAGVEDGENMELEAMKALQYEGTPVEIAQGFKEQGNEMTKAKRWNDGKEFYTKGISVTAQKPDDNTSSRSDGQEEKAKKLKDVQEACYVNRALCNLELRNYRSTTLDCAAALRINPRNIKAYYRSSSALFSLDKLAEASDACARGLTLDPKNAALVLLEQKIRNRADILDAGRRKKREELERAQKGKLILATALRARNIRTRNSTQPPDMEDAVIHLSPDPLSPKSNLNFPVVLLYPLHAQSDFIKAFSELDTIPQHLEYIFPLPWDEKQEYTVKGVESYMETSTGGLLKMGKDISLGKMLGQDGIVVVDGVVRVNILSKGQSAGWIETMKARKAKH